MSKLIDELKGHIRDAVEEAAHAAVGKKKGATDPGDTSGTVDVTESKPVKDPGDTSGTADVTVHEPEKDPGDTSGTADADPSAKPKK
jgi:hypothetical protein